MAKARVAKFCVQVEIIKLWDDRLPLVGVFRVM